METIIYKGIIFNEPDFQDTAKNEKLAYQAIKDGILIRQPCEVCGNKNTQTHHEIYSDYLKVRWLCASCHSTIHGIFKGMRSRLRVKNTETDIKNLIIWSELSRHITGGDRNCIRANKIPKKHMIALDKLFNEDLPTWWKIHKPTKGSK